MKTLDHTPLFTTGVTAAFLGIKPKTLINYENAALIKTHRSKTGRRLFSKADIFKVMMIRYFIKKKHLKFGSMKIIFNMLEESDRKGVNLYDVIIKPETVQEFVNAVKEKL